MRSKKTIAPPESSLRQRAEEDVKEKGGSACLSEVDVRVLCHELEVHQIELEMQNEELKRVQAELAVSEEKYRDLYEFAPIGYPLEGSGKILANLPLLPSWEWSGHTWQTACSRSTLQRYFRVQGLLPPQWVQM
jgi:hypothetical protein